MSQISLEQLIDLYSRLIAEVEASFRGEPAPPDSLDRLKRMLNRDAEADEVLEDADHKVLELIAELRKENPDLAASKYAEFFKKWGLEYVGLEPSPGDGERLLPVFRFPSDESEPDKLDGGNLGAFVWCDELEGRKEREMEGYPILKTWLTAKLQPDDPEWSWAVKQLRPEFDQGDELWHFDEPAPPGINAGAMGIAVVRDGKPIRTTITAIH